MGAKEVYKVFNPPLGYREVRDMEASLLWEDSYPDDATEAWSHMTGHKTKKLTMKIVFHPDRTCKDVRATMSYAGEVHGWLSEQVVVSPNRREVTLEVSKPKLGAEYIIEWDW